MGAYFNGKKVAVDADSGWKDLSGKIASGFKKYPGAEVRYRKIGKIVWLDISLSPSKATTADQDGLVMLSGLPFTFAFEVVQLRPGSGNGAWLMKAFDNQITFGRYRNGTSTKADDYVNTTTTTWLTVTGAFLVN